MNLPAHSVVSLQMPSPLGPMILLASRKGVAGIYFRQAIETTKLPREDRENRFLKKASRQLESYFRKDREDFSVALDLKGSAFQKEVWRSLRNIPYGQTVTYGDLAKEIGNPGAVRAVGLANAANPVSVIVPCHRVLGSKGKLTGYSGGLERKLMLLKLEGALLEGI